MEKIGIIAGRGNFPILFAREARQAGRSVMAVGIKGNTRGCLRRYVDDLRWVDVTEFKLIGGIFAEAGITEVALVGQVNPYSLFNPKVMGHAAVKSFLAAITDLRADTIFKAFAKNLQDSGLKLLDSTLFLSKYMPAEGLLAKRQLTEEEKKDIAFGFKIAKHLGGVDIGQSVCVKNGIILAVESIEGTDNTIKRAVKLCRSPVTLVKVSKPMQDMRFDVPVVGLRTVKHLPKGSCLAIEAKKTLFLDQSEAVGLADGKMIAISAVNVPTC